MASELIEDVLKERIRVIDHYKRLFAIICGLAITVACANAFSCWLKRDWIGLLQFVIMLVCVVPIFHGAERSLDIQYLQRNSKRPSPRRIVWDFLALLVTGLFFYVISQTIPDHRGIDLLDELATLRRNFLFFLFLFFTFDVLVLIAGLFKSSPHVAPPRGTEPRNVFAIYRHAHGWWIGANVVMAGTALWAWRSVGELSAPDANIPLEFWTIGAVAVVRTIIDYWTGWHFLFPREEVA